MVFAVRRMWGRWGGTHSSLRTRRPISVRLNPSKLSSPYSERPSSGDPASQWSLNGKNRIYVEKFYLDQKKKTKTLYGSYFLKFYLLWANFGSQQISNFIVGKAWCVSYVSLGSIVQLSLWLWSNAQLGFLSLVVKTERKEEKRG